MSIETLLRAAEAAGFAMASEENEQPARQIAANSATQLPVSHKPKESLSFSGTRSALQEPLALWARASFAGLLPVWHAKG